MSEYPGYEPLRQVLDAAFDQAANGKGRERHANDLPFRAQTIFQTAEAHGLGFLTGQAEKKARESHKLLELKGAEAAERELLGAINYIAAAVILVREKKQPANSEPGKAKDAQSPFASMPCKACASLGNCLLRIPLFGEPCSEFVLKATPPDPCAGCVAAADGACTMALRTRVMEAGTCPHRTQKAPA